MNRFSFIFSFLFLIFLTSFSQNYNTIIDFEDQIPSGFSFGGAYYEIVENPISDEINSSQNVLKLSKDEGAEPWAGVGLNAMGTINFDNNFQIRLTSYSPEVGKIVKVKLETSSGNVEGLTHEVDMLTTVANEWEVLTYDFSGAPDLDYISIIVFYDFGNQSEGTYYLDNIQVDESEYTINEGGPLDITANPADYWIGFMQGFELNGDYAFGNTWNIEDLKTTLDEANNQIILQPNFNAYDPNDPYWVNEDGSGNKIMEGITQVESSSAFNERPINFTVNVHEYTLDEAYTFRAFVRALDPNSGFNDITAGAYSWVIDQTGNYTINSPELPAGMLVQYGFTITGPVANPESESDLGSVVIRPEEWVDTCGLSEELVYNNLGSTEAFDDDNDGFTEFNLDAMLSSLDESLVVTFHQSFQDAMDNINPISSPYTNTVPFAETLYARVVNPNAEADDCWTIINFEIVVLDNDTELLSLLTSHNWRIDFENFGYRGVGAADGFTPAFWEAQAYQDPQDFGLIDDLVSFEENGNFTYDTGEDGAITGKKPEIDQAFDPDGTNAYPSDNEFNEYTAYLLEDFNDTFEIGNDGEYDTITFSENGGFQFYTAISPQTYQVIERTNTTIFLRNVGSEGNSWYVRLTNEAFPFICEIENFDLADLTIIDNDFNGNEIVNLSTSINSIDSEFSVTFYESEANAVNSTNAINENSIFASGSQPIFVRAESTVDNSCFFVNSFLVTIETPTLADFITQNPLLRVEAESQGHFGVGPENEQFPIYYGAAPYDKEGLGMYNDIYHFNSDGSLTIFTSGDIFGKATPILEAFGSSQGLEENEYGEYENYPSDNIDSSWVISSTEDAPDQISLSGLGYVGFFHGAGLTYDLISLDEDNVVLATNPSWDSPNRWFITLTSEDVNDVLSISSPSEDEIFQYNTEQVEISYFTTYLETDFMQYSVNGADPVNTSTGPFNIDVESGQSYEVTVSLTDSNYDQLSTPLTDTVNFSVANAPSISITSPDDFAEYPINTIVATFTYSISDFVVAEDGTGDGYIQFIIGNSLDSSGEFTGDFSTIDVYNSSEALVDLSLVEPSTTDLGDEYIIRLQLVDNDGVSIGIFDQVNIVIQNIDFTVIGSVEDGGSINSAPYGTYNSTNSYLLNGFELGVDGAIVYEVTYYPGNFNDIFGIDQLSSYNLDENDLAITSEPVVVNSIGANGEELNYDLNVLFDNPGAGLYKRHYQLVDNNNNPVSSILDQVTYSVMTLPSLSYEETATNGSILPNTTTQTTLTLNPVSLFMDSAAVGNNLIPGNGHIQYSINGSENVSIFENTVINIDVEPGQEYSVHAFLVDNLYQPVYPGVSVDYSFSVAGNSVVSDGIYWVDADVVDETNSTGSQDNPFKNIQTAIDTASNLDTIMVNPGTYVENISMDGKYVTITTPNPASSASSTIIDGGSNGVSVIDINGLGQTYQPDQESSILISGFTITNGLTASNEVASAIWLHSTSNIDLGINFENLIIENNFASDGPTVYFYYTNQSKKMQLNNVVIRDNNSIQTFYGFNQEFEMNACEFYNNEGQITISFWGNGNTSYSTIKNSIVRDNLTSKDLNVTDVIIMNSNIMGNSLTNNFSGNSAVVNSIIGGGQFFTNDGLLTVKNSHLAEGQPQIINQITNFLTYEDNSEGEILYTDIGNNDFSLSDYSPAIGGGINSISLYSITYDAPSEDFLGNSRPNPEGSNVDMGAFENTLAETVHNTNIYVSTSGTDEDTVGTEDKPFLTIQAAINYAIEGDNIFVGPGEYVEQISVLNKGVNLIAVEPHSASIALPATGNTLSFSSNIGIINSSITGFNIYPSQNIGGTNGIWAHSDHYVSINDCIISGFDDKAIGTGVSSVTVKNSVFVDNRLVLFQDNCSVGSLGLVATFYNSTIIDHEEIYASCVSNSANFVNTIIIGTSDTYSGYTSPPGFNRVITDSQLVVPQSNSTWQLAPESFIDMYFTDHENRDYTLQNTSPAIGYGYYPISTDILGNSRPAPLGSNVDIGAYENELGVPNNAPPRMDEINNVNIDEDEGEQDFYITGIVDGDIREIQELSFAIESDNSDLFESMEIQYDQGQSIATFSYNTSLNAYGTAEITVTLSDDGGTENDALDFTSQTLSINVAAINDQPSEIILINGNTLPENTIDLIVDLLSTSDVDDDTFTYELVSGEGDMDNSNFTISDSELIVTSPFDFEIQEQASIRVRTTDPEGLSHEEVLIIQIDNLNDASVVQNQTVTTDEDTIIAITLEGSDLENDPMQFYIASTPNLGTLYQTEDGQTITSIISTGDLVINSQNIVLYEPFENGYGEDYAVFNYYINDGNQDSLEGEITVDVNPVNDESTSISLTSNEINENLSDQIGQFFTIDDDPEDQFTYEFVNGTGDTDNELFTINDNSLSNNIDFDFEEQAQYSVRVRSFNENDSIEQQFIINVLNVNDISVISILSDSFCEGELADGSVEISEINQTVGDLFFNWTGPNGFTSSEQSIQNLSPGVYTFEMSDDYFTFSESFIISQTPNYNDLQICYITSDESDFTKNRIYFNSAGSYNVATFEVLRETSVVDEYESIGFVLPSDDSFLDTSSNNQQQQYKYKVRSVDACGVNSDLSSEHYNTLLQANLAAGGSVNLSWSPYFGVDYSTFYIYRSVNNAEFELLNAIPSNQFTFNDTSADTSVDDYRYYVAIIIDDCGEGNRSTVSTVTLRSNLLSIVDGSLSNNELSLNNEITIYPNPTANIINLSYPDYLQINKIEVYNSLGQIIKRGSLSTNIISLESNAQGVYFIKIYSSEGIINKRVIKN